MEKERALRILNCLAEGTDPTTGEVYPSESPYQHPEVVRALYWALRELGRAPKSIPEKRERPAPGQAGKPWTPEEDQALLQAFEAGETVGALSQKHARTKGAVTSRLVRHGKLIPPMQTNVSQPS